MTGDLEPVGPERVIEEASIVLAKADMRLKFEELAWDADHVVGHIEQFAGVLLAMEPTPMCALLALQGMTHWAERFCNAVRIMAEAEA